MSKALLVGLRERVVAALEGGLFCHRNAVARLLFLPPCGADLNPIGNAFSKLKAMLRKAATRTRDHLWKAIARIIDTVTPNECANAFAAAGYDAD